MITAEERPPCRSGREGPCPSGWPRAIEVNSERCSVRLPARERFRSPQRNSKACAGTAHATARLCHVRPAIPPGGGSSAAETSHDNFRFTGTIRGWLVRLPNHSIFGPSAYVAVPRSLHSFHGPRDDRMKRGRGGSPNRPLDRLYSRIKALRLADARSARRTGCPNALRKRL